MLQNIDGRLRAHIHGMVDRGVTEKDEMRRHVQQLTEEVFDELPSQKNRRFWPLDKDIENHIQLAYNKKQ